MTKNKQRKVNEDIRDFNLKIEELKRAKELKKLENTTTIGLPSEMQKKYPAIFETADKYIKDNEKFIKNLANK